MKGATTFLLLLLSTQLARAQQTSPAAPSPASASLGSSEPPLRTGFLLEARRHAHYTLDAGYALAGASVTFLALGGGITRDVEQQNIGWAFLFTGASLALPAAWTVLYEAGDLAALRHGERADDAALDRAERRARRIERSGLALTVIGAALLGAGIAVAIVEIPEWDDGYFYHGNYDGYYAGIAMLSIGAASLVTGSLVWPYGAGEHHGVRQARRALRLAAGGVAGTF